MARVPEMTGAPSSYVGNRDISPFPSVATNNRAKTTTSTMAISTVVRLGAALLLAVGVVNAKNPFSIDTDGEHNPCLAALFLTRKPVAREERPSEFC